MRSFGGGSRAVAGLFQELLESVLDACEQQGALIPSLGLVPKHIIKHALQYVKAYSRQHPLAPGARALLRAKCSEFGRAPIAEVIKYHVHRLGVPVGDLWPAGYTFDRGLAEALQTRNEFVHGGGIDDPQAAVFNATRLRALTERLILALLGWDLAKVGRLSDEALKFANFWRRDP